MKYFPDRWVIVEIEKDGTKIHKVFATWLGGYLNGDQWRLNSGIKGTKKEGPTFVVVGDSGSEYVCRQGAYGTSAYTGSVLAGFDAQKPESVKFKVLAEQGALRYLESLL